MIHTHSFLALGLISVGAVAYCTLRAAPSDPTAALLAMRELSVKPGECVFVGDSKMDVKTGVNSGAYPVGVLWGFREKNELIEGGARAIIEKPYELLEIIDSLG